MYTTFHLTKATVVLAILALATVTTTTKAFGAINLPNPNLSQTGVFTGGGGGGLPPEQQGYPPRTPIITGPMSRTTTKLTIRLVDKSLYEQGYELYRGPSTSGPWIKIASRSPFTGQLDFTDSGLSPDTQYCYRLRAFNAYGESFSSGNCFSTLDGRSVSRIQLRLRTASIADAGTDDSIMVALNGSNATWLDYGRNDFERGDEFTYEVLLDGVSDLANIETLYFHKEGTDGWCLASLALVVNDVEIYNEHFGSTAAGCQWINRASGYKNSYAVSRSTLRAHALWQNYPRVLFPVITLLPKEDIEDRIEGIVGDELYYDVYVPYWGAVDPHWGDLQGARYVEASKKDNRTLTIDLDFSIDGPVNLNVDVDFDLRFEGTCKVGTTPAELRIIPENVRASTDFSWLTEALTLWFINLAEDVIAGHIVAILSETLKQQPPLNFPAGSEVGCVTATVHDDRSVTFTVTPVPRIVGTTPPGPTLKGTFTTTP